MTIGNKTELSFGWRRRRSKIDPPAVNADRSVVHAYQGAWSLVFFGCDGPWRSST